MRSSFQWAFAVFLLSLTIAVLLLALAQNAPAASGTAVKYLQQKLPTATPQPTPAVYEPVKGYRLNYNPPASPTPAPTGGYQQAQGYRLNYNPPASPTPAPSGGYEPVQGYRLNYNPPATPLPTGSTLPNRLRAYPTAPPVAHPAGRAYSPALASPLPPVRQPPASFKQRSR